MYASSDLRNEHEGIMKALQVLKRMAKATSLEPRDAMEMAEFLSLFADKCHHGKEEGLMFPAMEAAGIQREGGPIGQMLKEHVQGRALIAALRASAAASDKEAFSQAAETYVSLMTAHISKENNILFAMADKRLPQAEQDSLLGAFAEHERIVMGPGIHEKLHAMLERLEDKHKE